jgi:hypothetical protein
MVLDYLDRTSRTGWIPFSREMGNQLVLLLQDSSVSCTRRVAHITGKTFVATIIRFGRAQMNHATLNCITGKQAPVIFLLGLALLLSLSLSLLDIHFRDKLLINLIFNKISNHLSQYNRKRVLQPCFIVRSPPIVWLFCTQNMVNWHRTKRHSCDKFTPDKISLICPTTAQHTENNVNGYYIPFHCSFTAFAVTIN